jgi:hypothetical protein
MLFRIPIDPRKVNFVREHLHEIDYKGMRDLLKLALIEKLGKLPRIITEFQRLQLSPVEDVSLVFASNYPLISVNARLARPKPKSLPIALRHY